MNNQNLIPAWFLSPERVKEENIWVQKYSDEYSSDFGNLSVLEE